MEGVTLEQPGFDREKSPLRGVYELVDAATPHELYQRYLDADQKLMREGAWDYHDDTLLVNKVKEVIESISIAALSEQHREKEWAQEILWFWYHHAISCALGRYSDKAAAARYAERAIEYQDADHPNMITRLFYLLTHDKMEEARAWARQIQDDIEKKTAAGVIEWYEREVM